MPANAPRVEVCIPVLLIDVSGDGNIVRHEMGEFEDMCTLGMINVGAATKTALHREDATFVLGMFGVGDISKLGIFCIIPLEQPIGTCF